MYKYISLCHTPETNVMLYNQLYLHLKGREALESRMCNLETGKIGDQMIWVEQNHRWRNTSRAYGKIKRPILPILHVGFSHNGKTVRANIY